MEPPGNRVDDGPHEESGPKSNKRQADGKALKEEKRRKFLAKQEKKKQARTLEQERESWFEKNQHFSYHVSMQDLEKKEPNLESLLKSYRNLQEGEKKSAEYFIAEGTETVRLLIQNATTSSIHNRSRVPPIELHSVFIKTSAFFEDPVKLLADVEEAAKKTEQNDPPFEVLVGSEEVQSEVVGFPFCRGALACGKLPSWREDEDWLMNYLKNRPKFSQENSRHRPSLRLVALDGVCDTANLGSVVRCASAFGLDALVLSHDCCDVWYRKAVRVSMGHVCRIPCVRVKSLAATLQRLRGDLNVVSYAAVIDKDADCILGKINHGDVPGAWCCVVGNEGTGISKEVATACSTRLRIDMEDGVDSLSVPVATGILLNGLKEREA